MKKLLLLFAIIAIAVVSCQPESENIPSQETVKVDMSDFYLYTDQLEEKSAKGTLDKCHTMQVLNRQLKENPGLYNRMYAIEKNTRTAIALKGGRPDKPGKPDDGEPTTPSVYSGSITIPVVINILDDPNNLITDSQINSQITILNQDFNDSNPNTSGTPDDFINSIADVDITFIRASEIGDNGVIRETSSKSSWGTRDAMKKSKRGGINPTDPSKYLNIWVCNIGGGILGYAQFPGGSASTDGVVITSSAFGITSGVYGMGRTATHEVGHWLNLRHIWGDGPCSYDDYVEDTPRASGPNYGNQDGTCLGVVNSCDEGAGDLPDMTMNYMDYVFDDCMYMFTNDQNDRMRTLFGNGGARLSFVQ